MGKHKGFTIVELLIVIVVIGVLAAITIVSYNGVQRRARATSIVSDLKAAEKAFVSYKAITNTGSWWDERDPALTEGSSNPSIASIIAAQPAFRDFLQQPPTTAGLGTTSVWAYDNDSDIYNGCSASLAGVNLVLGNVTSTDMMQTIDDTMDDGNLSCGKIRYAGGWLLYALANKA